MIKKDFLNQKTKSDRFNWRSGYRQINYFKYIKNYFKRSLSIETVIFSIDDFYKTLEKKVNRKNSPLFLTRGTRDP